MGPQSQADAYETLAYREKRRRDSKSEAATATPKIVEERNTKGKSIALPEARIYPSIKGLLSRYSR